MDSRVQVVFFGEVLPGFRAVDVRRELGRLLDLDEPGTDELFSGERWVLDPSMDFFDAQGYEERLRAIGARVHIEPADAGNAAPAPVATPGPAPARDAEPATDASPPVQAPAPTAPVSAALPLDELVTCPNCGEQQTNRVICRACGSDIPMAIAYRREADADARAQRLARARARRGLPPLGDEAAAADAPSAWGLGFSGRLGRLPYLTAAALVVTAINALFVYAIPNPSPVRLYTMIVGTLLLLLFLLRLSVLRAHDFNVNGWWALLLFVPYLGVLVALALLLLPPIGEENDHGGMPRPGNTLLALLSVALMTVTLVATYRWIATLVEEVIPAAGPPLQIASAKEVEARLGSTEAVAAFRDEYMAAAGHKAFAASPAGSWGWRAGAASSEAAAAGALERCDAKRKPYTPECELVNVNDRWVQR
jgi:uncharacterized membrane protein YhaH (DUF805 family)/ribosomal protein L32